MTQQQISRRTVVKGAAWATPAVVAATAMPAFAASCDPSVQLRTFLARHEYQGKGYTYRLAFIGGTPGSPYTGLVVAGLTPSHTIEGATIELMLSDVSDDVHFEPDPSSAIGDRANRWSPLARVGTVTKGGRVYDRFVSTYIGPPLPFQSISMSIPLAFISQHLTIDDLEPTSGYTIAKVTVNGKTFTHETPPRNLGWGIGGFRSRGASAKGGTAIAVLP
ncbi:MAG: hypothetical protein Q4B08_12895 [Propionibacteriaceae bacterium]|nr:hypothetical protein [Propionibacteriaceae bacterium]